MKAQSIIIWTLAVGIVILLIGAFVGNENIDAAYERGKAECDSLIQARVDMEYVMMQDIWELTSKRLFQEISALRDTVLQLREELEQRPRTQKPEQIFHKASAIYQQQLFEPQWIMGADTIWGMVDSTIYVEQENLDWLYRFSQWGLANGVSIRGDTLVLPRTLIVEGGKKIKVETGFCWATSDSLGNIVFREDSVLVDPDLFEIVYPKEEAQR